MLNLRPPRHTPTLRAHWTAGVDGVKVPTLGEAPEPRPRGTDRFAGCPQDRQAHRARYLNPLADECRFRARSRTRCGAKASAFFRTQPCRSTKEHPRPESSATPTMSLTGARSAGTSAARSPMIMQGAMVLPVVTRGMIEPSAMRRFSIP